MHLTQVLLVSDDMPECYTRALSCLEGTNPSSLGNGRPEGLTYRLNLLFPFDMKFIH
jgi:hypothetical protein